MDQAAKPPCKNCQKSMPYSVSYASAMRALAMMNETKISVVPLISLAIKETGANPWFVGTEQLMIDNLHVLVRETGMTQQNLMDLVYKNQVTRIKPVPKFRYEPSWSKIASEIGKKHGMSTAESTLLSCSWGVGQKAGCFYFDENLHLTNIDGLRDFIFSPELQWLTLLRQFKRLLSSTGGNFPLAYTRYNGPNGATEVSDYGLRVQSISVGVEQLLTRNKIKLCLD